MSATAFQRMRREKIAKMRAEAEAKVEVETPKALIEFTKKELMAMLDEKGIVYDKKANKATLISLLEQAQSQDDNPEAEPEDNDEGAE